MRIGSLKVKVSTTLVVGVWVTPKEVPEVEVEAVGAVKVEDVVVVVVFMLLVGLFLKN